MQVLSRVGVEAPERRKAGAFWASHWRCAQSRDVLLGSRAALTWSYCWRVRQTAGFARMPDGERIAFAAVGSGPAVVLPAWWVSHVVEDWHFEPLRRFVEDLAVGRMVARYDRLGTGVAERERSPETVTAEFEVATLRAVLDELRLGLVTVMGISCGSCTGLTFRTSGSLFAPPHLGVSAILIASVSSAVTSWRSWRAFSICGW